MLSFLNRSTKGNIPLQIGLVWGGVGLVEGLILLLGNELLESAGRFEFWLFILILAPLASAGIGWWFAKQIFSPLKALVLAMDQISVGNLQHRFEIRSQQDIIKQLESHFNQMAEKISEHKSKSDTLNAHLYEDVSKYIQELSESKQRTEIIAEALYRVTERANAANRAKSQFLANMSHELRTPLNSISLYLDLLLRNTYGELTPKQRDRLQKASESAKLLMQLINDVLDLSKIEAGELSINHETVSLQEILQSSNDLISPWLDKKKGKIRFIQEIEPNLPPVIGDGKRIQQIILNLLSNALKFTETGEIHLRAYANYNSPPPILADLPQGSWVIISVEDSGIGIPEDKLNLIFDEFKQVDDSNTREHGGTGLGLAICKHLMRALNGHIGVVSQLGKGSTFSIALPTTIDHPLG